MTHWTSIQAPACGENIFSDNISHHIVNSSILSQDTCNSKTLAHGCVMTDEAQIKSFVHIAKKIIPNLVFHGNILSWIWCIPYLFVAYVYCVVIQCPNSKNQFKTYLYRHFGNPNNIKKFILYSTHIPRSRPTLYISVKLRIKQKIKLA